MKLSKLFLNKIAEDLPPKQPEPTKEKPVAEADTLRSNIDQFWMNTEDLKNDLYKFLSRMQNKDPQLARYTRNAIRNILAKFRYVQPQKSIGND